MHKLIKFCAIDTFGKKSGCKDKYVLFGLGLILHIGWTVGWSLMLSN